MRGFHLSDETRSTIASSGPLGQAWLDGLAIEAPGVFGPGYPVAPDVPEVRVIVAHQERVTLRAGGMFVKLDTDQARLDVEVEAMMLAPVPTPAILWRKPFELALAALPGTAIAQLGMPSTAPPSTWVAAGAAVRVLHDAPLPSWPGRSLDNLAEQLDVACEWLLANDILPIDVVTRNRRYAETVLQPKPLVFIHGDLQVAHIFVDGDTVTGIIDWSEGCPGDALFDLAILTLGHPEHLGDVVSGYGLDVDLELIRGWWSFRCLQAIRWLDEHGFGPVEQMPEVTVLRSQAAGRHSPK